MQPYEQFEKAWADYIGTDFAVSCNTGTSALHLALAALRIGPGDEVIAPNFTMAAVPFAVHYTGAKPVFVECGADLNIDPELIREKITPRTKAIIAVHIYGRPCDMSRILSYGIPVIEDCAEAHGATINGQKIGSFGTLSCFSFYRNKILHAEEGGAVCTNDEALARRIKYLKNMAFDEAHTYLHEEVGFNYRMPDTTARQLLGSLPGIEEEIKARKVRAEKIRGFWELPRPTGSVVWVKDILFDTNQERNEFLNAGNYQVRPFFRPMTTLPMWKTDERGPSHDFSERGAYIIV